MTLNPARFCPVVCLLLAACSFDPSGIEPTNANDNGNVNDNSNGNTNTADCGNGFVEPGEECDGSDLDGETCVSLGYAGSGLACDGVRGFDTSACDPALTCGNGTVDAGEDCEDADLGGASCASLGYHGTGLACDGTCHFDTTVCEANGMCGDDQIDAPYGEECDGSNVDGQDCASLGQGVGPVTCTAACTFDLSACGQPEICDDHIDNDGDSTVDCWDLDCASDPWCVNNYSTQFGVTNERVDIGSLADVTGTSPVTTFSVAFWVRFNGTQDDWATPLGASSGSGWQDGFGFYHSSEERIRFWINAYGSSRASTSPGLLNGVWYHVVGTYDANLPQDNIKIYLNGAIAGTGDSQSPVSSSGLPIRIGTLYDDDLAGNVDEVAFWPVALSAQDVQGIYNGGVPFNLTYNHSTYNQASSLSAYYRMGDQDTYPDIADHAGSHNGVVAVGSGNEFVTAVP